MSQKDTTKEATNLIAQAMREALRTLSQEAQDAKHLIATDAETASKLLAAKNIDGVSDHDTQIKLVEAVANLDQKFTEKFADLKADIKGLIDGTANKISCLEIKAETNSKDILVLKTQIKVWGVALGVFWAVLEIILRLLKVL